MIKLFIRVCESQFMLGFRFTLLVGTAFWLLFAGISSINSQITDYNLRGMERTANEHRFSVLETEMQGMKDKIDDLATHSYITLLALSGILGETGLRILKGKKTT